MSTDEALYTKFRSLLQEDGYLTQLEDLSSFDFALSIHSTAPRIEAHYQYYNSSVAPYLDQEDADSTEAWVHTPLSGQRYLSPTIDEPSAKQHGSAGDEVHHLPFDRILGIAHSGTPSILYADITSESFRKFHQTVSTTARQGTSTYRVRYKPSIGAAPRPLYVSGYGVDLSLKRTDYIVIDDRQDDEGRIDDTPAPADGTLSEDDLSDLRPLSASEVLRLGVKAASFIVASDEPFDTLVRLSRDFPKHSGAVAATNISTEFMKEHHKNREVILTPGFNALWINGVQIMPRDLDAYSLLDHLRRERKMINGVRELGLTASEAIDLLSHEAVTAAQVDQDVQRYDWRDATEGGNIIIWLNDIEKDKRYADWSSSITALLQRTYPGQLPPVRKDVHTLIVPVDFSDFADVNLVVESLQSFVKRKVPIRFGLVPRVKSAASVQQTRLVYSLLDNYGLGAALDYLSTSVIAGGRKFGPPQQQHYDTVVASKKLRRDRTAIPFSDVIVSDVFGDRLQGAQAYLGRLADDAVLPPVLINGVAVPRTEEWLQAMSQRVSMDVRVVQQAVFEETVNEDSHLPDLFLAHASLRRNPLIVPEDDKEIRHLDLGDWPPLSTLPTLSFSPDTIERELVHMTVIADFDTPEGFHQLMEAILFARDRDNVELTALHVPGTSEPTRISGALGNRASETNWLLFFGDKYDDLVKIGGPEQSEKDSMTIRRELHEEAFIDLRSEILDYNTENSRVYWLTVADIAAAAGVTSGHSALIINGRIVGPTSHAATIDSNDLDSLMAYERKKRLLPAALAIEGLQLGSKASSPLAFARISNLIALSQVSDTPEGIFDAAPTVRTSIFQKWDANYTAIKVGEMDAATIRIHASIDPVSEAAQRWIPIIKALSDLEGVATCLFLNPRERLDELPIKRFYRHVLEPKPTFEQDGSLQALSAKFSGLPADALLNMGMDLPSSWLVAPKDSIHDLDNIKLSAVKGGTDIEATYELEHILIEGHSRDVTLGPPPRGAQLVLGTEHDPHFADTIVMANLGYFQFKANPGVFNLTLQKGRSEEIFNIDSAGSLGYSPQLGDNFTEIALMSFRGITLFPRLSRKPDMEDEDVLEASKSALEQAADNTDRLLSQVGLPPISASKYLSKAVQLGSRLLRRVSKTTDISVASHADINIFSVASGHLYERMLNIMMLSVMKHTKHTVKFWFIEQFLSPSFKTFLPIMAEEYGFKYEMVTYKWPHWLRGQKEKQREIWGYKILFLDVLFPLDLDKVIFVDADQIVRTDMYELVQHNLQGAPYGFTPMCDSRTEMEGFRFWKQGYWKNFLRGLPYHISALYVVDLKEFRRIAAGDRLRQQYHQLSADPASLSNLDQDLPNHMQMVLPIHSLPQNWLWCETWCSDEALKEAKTIDLCNNPQTKEPKLDRARRQVPEWTQYDDEIAAVAKKHKDAELGGSQVGDASSAGAGDEGESIQEQLQREDAEKERRKSGHVRDEL